MRSFVAMAALALAVIPASAQQSGSPSQPGAAQQQGSAKSGIKSPGTQTRLQQSLEQAGFKSVKIVDAAYLVHARTADGNMAVLYIDPPAAALGTTGSNASGTAKPMTAAQVRASLEKAGFKEVQVVDSAFLVNAQTSDGANATMYIDPSPDGARSWNQGDGSSGVGKGSKSNK